MKKNSFIITLLLLFNVSIYSQDVTVNEAKDVAIWVMEQYCLGQRAAGLICSETPTVSTVKTFAREGRNTMYAVNMELGGHVLVAADDRVTPILAISYENEFPNDTADMPPALKELLADYENTIVHVRNSGRSMVADPMWTKARSRADIYLENTQRSASEYEPGESLFKIRRGEEVLWGQSRNNSNEFDINRSYNKFCPDWYDAWEGRCYVGCPAVAMGQLMWYWQWPYAASVPAAIYMTGVTHGGKVFHEYDWDLMPKYIDETTSEAEIDMIAGFLRDCGYACNSIYMANGTSSDIYAAQRGMKNCFSYETDGVEWRMFHNKKKWDQKIKDEIDALRPVIYMGANDKAGGHAFVVDGYNASFNDKFHINFGWGGKDNGCYSLKIYSEADSILEYHNFQMAMFGIRPSYSGNMTKANVTVTNNKTNSTYYCCNGDMTLNSVKVSATGSLVCHAGSSIRLTTGTRIYQGGNFHGSIKPFPNPYLSNSDVNMLSVGYEDDGELEFADKLSEQAKSQPIQIYPNPASDIVNISSPLPISNVRLINLQGKELAIFSDKSNCISLSGLDNGLYFLEITFDDGLQLTFKIIKQ